MNDPPLEKGDDEPAIELNANEDPEVAAPDGPRPHPEGEAAADEDALGNDPAWANGATTGNPLGGLPDPLEGCFDAALGEGKIVEGNTGARNGSAVLD